MEFFRRIFSADFMPHRFCLRIPELIWLHAVSDGAIALAYFLIPVALILLIRRRRDLTLPWLFLSFACFILTCGATHVLEVVTLWFPVYWLDGFAKLLAAAASLITAVLLMRSLPWIASLPGPQEWRLANDELAAQVKERVRAEAKFRGLMEAAPDAIVVVNHDGKIVLVNAQVEKLFGYRRGDLIGVNAAALIPKRFRSVISGVQDTPFSQAAAKGAELFGQRKDGIEFPAEITVSSLATEDGVLTSAAIRDVTEQKEAQRQIIELNRQLQEAATEAQAANRAKSVFLSTMSHEIRTPMNAILGYTQLMLRDPALNSPIRSNVEIIGRSGEHLLGLINDVLDLSKIEAGRVELRPSTFHLSRLLQDLAGMFRVRAEMKALRFELLVDTLISYVRADEGKLRQILINLVGNAIKFTQSGQITLRVNLCQRGDEQTWLYCEVADTGSGMSPADQSNLFQPFYQAEQGLNTTGGTGLGLAISRSYAQLMGGNISLTSELGKGSVFRLEIPVERTHGPVERQLDRRRVSHLQDLSEAPTILIVDDQWENRDWLTRLLKVIGFSVLESDNGATALATWEKSKPQLILMDVHMPVMDGLEATRLIKATPEGQKTPIVILTASGMDSDRREIHRAGADAFLIKPCLEQDLLDTLAIHLGVSYDYENPEAGTSTGPRAARNEDLSQIPHGLLKKLYEAVSDGDMNLMNQLITQVRDSAGGASAATLQQLADSYDYDSLINLLKATSK